MPVRPPGLGCGLTDSGLAQVPFAMVPGQSVSADLNFCLSLKVSYFSAYTKIQCNKLFDSPKKSHINTDPCC